MKPQRPPSKRDIRASLRALSAAAPDQERAAAAGATLGLDKPERRIGGTDGHKRPATVAAGASEAQVLNAVIGLLRHHPAVAKVWRNNVGMVDFNGQPVRFGFTGLADISFVMKGGRAGFIEVKRERGGLISEAQQTFIDEMRAAGAIAGIVRSVDEAVLLLKYAVR